MLRADAAHCLLQPGECAPVPVEVNAELEKERAVFGAELVPEQVKVIHVASMAEEPVTR